MAAKIEDGVVLIFSSFFFFFDDERKEVRKGETCPIGMLVSTCSSERERIIIIRGMDTTYRISCLYGKEFCRSTARQNECQPAIINVPDPV